MFSFNSPRTLGVALMLICSAFAKKESEILAAFDQPVQIFGNMILNDIDFVDGLKVQIYSPTNKSLTVTMNNKPLNGSFVTGTTGSNFRTIRGFSYMFKTNEPSTDLIAKVEIPYDPLRLQNATIDQANTFVAKLADDKKAWMIMDNMRTVQKSAFKTSMSQMTSIDGEYVILGRNSQDIGNIFVPFGEGDAFSVNITGGPGRQDAEFADGLRFAIESDRTMRMNVKLKYPISTEQIPEGMISLNNYAWVVNTTVAANIDVPLAPAPPAAGSATGMATLAPAANPPPGVPIPGPPGAGMPPMPSPAISGIPPLSPPVSSGMPGMPGLPAAAGRPGFPFGSFGSVKRQAPAVGPEPIAQPDPNAPSASPAAPLPIPAAPSPSPIPSSALPAAPSASSAAPRAPPVGSSASLAAPSASPSATRAPAPPPSEPQPKPAPTAGAGPEAGTVSVAQIDFPVNMQRLAAALPKGQNGGNMNPQNPSSMSGLKFTIGRRALGAAANDRFEPAAMMVAGNGNAANAENMQMQLVNGRLQFSGVTKLDGEYVILIPAEQGIVDGGGKTGKAEIGLKQTSSSGRNEVEWKYVFAVVALIGGMLSV